MKIGISAFAWTSDFQIRHLEVLPVMEEVGFDALEIPMFAPERLPIDAIRRAFEASALDCTVCAILPANMNPISPSQESRHRATDHLKNCIDAAACMGAKVLAGPLFAPIGYLPEHRPTDEEWEWAVEAFQAIGGELEAADMSLAIEPVNRSETFFLRTATDAALLCERIGDPRIGVTIDTFHANIEERSIPGAIHALGKRLRHIHASENDRGVLGSGHIPFDEIMSALKRSEYQGFVTVEGFGYLPVVDCPGSLWARRDLSPERLAAESYRYLSGLLANGASLKA